MERTIEHASIALLAAWMAERYFRTFRLADEPLPGFDATLRQRERRVGVTFGALWDGGPTPGAEAFAHELTEDLDVPGGYVLWVPPGGELPQEEPRHSERRLAFGRALHNLEPGERREVRLPVTVALAKVDAEGSYVSVAGPLAEEWTSLSEGVDGAYHLDARELRRLPEERAEIDLLVARIRDRASMLAPGEVAPVEVHDYWLVSRLPGDDPAGVTIFGAPPDVDPRDGAGVRRLLRAHLRRAGEQRDVAGAEADLTALVLASTVGHSQQEMATAALRGMSPGAYGGIDLIVVVADGRVRQVLQPRSLPWDAG